MQNTRLNRLTDDAITRLTGWLQNPWRRISLVILGLLFGNFLATALATSAGQEAELDILAAAFLVILTEAISWFVYRRSDRQAGNKARSLFAETLNATKIGLSYGLVLEAFKLGS